MPGATDRRSPAPGVPRWVPGILAALGVGCTLVAIAVGALAERGRPVDAGDATLGLLYPLVAALVLGRQPGNRVGWLLMVSVVTGPYLLASEYVALAGTTAGPGASFAAWLAAWGFVPYYVIVALVPLYFPDGTLPSPRWRRIARVLGTVVVVGTLAAMFRSGPLDYAPAFENPLAVGLWINLVLLLCSFTAFLVGGGVGVAAQLVRMRRAEGTERARLQWLLLGESVLFVCAIASVVLDLPVISSTLFAVGFAALPLAVAVAVLRHGLFDVGQVISRAVVFSVLSGILLIAYAVVVGLLGELTAGQRRIAVALTALAAIGAAAGWERAQRAVDRLLYGERRDPFAVATRLGSTLDSAAAPSEALQALADEVARVLRLPAVAIEPADPRLPSVACATDARLTGDVDTWPLTSLGQDVGRFAVTHRHPGERWRRSERDALDDAARRAAALAWAAGLVADLQASRERIVAGREEERRRLRHDLHDGVGPELAGMALQLERLTGRLSGEPEMAAFAGRLRDQMRRTVAAVRRAVDDLRPPALDELGLVDALREHVAAYRLPVTTGGPGGTADPARVSVSAEALPTLRAAVEVAAYRIATEAVANAVRHAGAATCTVALGLSGDDLLVEISDDGRGVPADAVPGVGSTSMRERAAELGGSLDVTTASGAGTTVRARLPLAAR
ncbi:sensor histidine kinase [Blastococcus sp. CT_GayMR20]|uniref:sensor histidine kinase n=1 Tax=Blastococcus sp. CT_GayMR20 TaxID=2559609 RepID=UPI0010730015|nr:sensor histidine kinase [Blastococcus sp. CT_GayMR20]TFV93753.1 sensor histidine kinase [Blastococcus sp. CT_GayMR20]TFV93842.1 sensor histidine kinase [Blastococcus sp. CT_GayMR20]